MTRREFDFVIVGAGSAGCVLANRISADPSVTVALLEAGGEDNYFWIDIPVGYLFTIGNPRTDWRFITEAEAGLNGRRIDYARGRVLGGCSSINAMIYMRGQKADFDHWASLGNCGWSWDDVLPYFKKSEDFFLGPDDFHGAGGELRVEGQRVSWEILDAWRDAAQQCGIPKIDEFNRGDNFGAAYFHMNQRRGRRWSAARGFLHPVRARRNLTVLTKAHAERITFAESDQGLTATGLIASIDGAPAATFSARKEVILAAGAIGSPQLLQLSGVGSGSLLQSYGVALRHELIGVGENLQDHLQIRSVYKVSKTKTLNSRARTLTGRAAMAAEYLLFRTGPLTMPPSQLGAFAMSDGEKTAPNIEWHVQPLSLDRFGAPLHDFDAITPSVCNLKPTSRGSVRIKSPAAKAQPAIRLNYLSTDEDKQVAIDGLRMTRTIMAAPALRNFSPEEWRPGREAATDSALLSAAGDLGATIFHPVGTCAMGGDGKAVVDSELRVRGVKGLRVIDASIMPQITSGNTNAPTMMIAEKGSDLIRSAWKLRHP